MSWDLLEEAKKIISINSVTTESNREIADYVCTLLKSLDLDVQIQKGMHYHKEHMNVIAQKGPASGDTVLFTTHVDTVSPGDFSMWDKTGGNPFRATIDTDKIYGLGAADVKLDLLCKIKALEKFKGIPFKNPFFLAATYGEESGLAGARKLIEENICKPKYAVVGEPSNLSIVYAHKGYMVVQVVIEDTGAEEKSFNDSISRVDFFGRSAHSSTPQLGINAIQKALDFLRIHKGKYELIGLQGGELVNVIPDKTSIRLKAREKLIPEGEGEHLVTEKFKKTATVFTQDFVDVIEDVHGTVKKLSSEFRKVQDEEFDPPSSVLSIGVATTQDKSVTFLIGMRLIPQTNAEEIMGFLQSNFDSIHKKYPKVNLNLKLNRHSPPMKTDTGARLISEAKDVLRSMGLQETIVTKASSTEASIYRSMGAEVIVWGPGISIGNVHKPNEFNYLHHLTLAVTFYERLIEALCVKPRG